MKTLVTYISQTGNTKKVAEAIYDAIPGEKDLKELKDVNSLDDYGFTFIGFPVNNAGPVMPAKKFVKKMAEGKKIALFSTHASPPGHETLEKTTKNCKKIAANSELVGFYECQGELSEEVANMLLKMPNPEIQEFGKLRPDTIGHPDDTDLENARNFAKEMIGK